MESNLYLLKRTPQRFSGNSSWCRIYKGKTCITHQMGCV